MNRLTKQQQRLGLVAAILVSCVGIFYFRPLLNALPTSGFLADRRAELISLQTRLEKRERQKSRRDTQLAELRQECRGILWQGHNKVLSTVLQNELQTIARRERVTLRSVGSPKSQELGEGVREVEVSVRLQADMKEIARFLARVDAASPRFFWTTCTMRAVNQRTPDIVDLSGRIKAVFATGVVEELVFEEDKK